MTFPFVDVLRCPNPNCSWRAEAAKSRKTKNVESPLLSCPKCGTRPLTRVAVLDTNKLAYTNLYRERRTSHNRLVSSNVQSINQMKTFMCVKGTRSYPAKQKITMDNFMPLYNQQLSDRTIAAKLHVSRSSIRGFRHRHNIPSHTQQHAEGTTHA